MEDLKNRSEPKQNFAEDVSSATENDKIVGYTTSALLTLQSWCFSIASVASCSVTAVANAVVSASAVEGNESAKDLMMLQIVAAPGKDLMHHIHCYSLQHLLFYCES